MSEALRTALNDSELPPGCGAPSFFRFLDNTAHDRAARTRDPHRVFQSGFTSPSSGSRESP